MNTFMITLLTIFLFIIVFGVLYMQLHSSKRTVKIWFFLFLIFSAGPLVYMLYDDYTHNYLDANIGLGLAYFYTWFMTVVAAILTIVTVIRRK